MKKLILPLLLSLSGTFSAIASAAVVYQEAYVTRVGTYGDGGLWIMLDATVNMDGCPAARLDIAPNHAELDTWQELARASVLHNKKVSFQASGCRTFVNNGTSVSLPTLDDSTYSWFGLVK